MTTNHLPHTARDTRTRRYREHPLRPGVVEDRVFTSVTTVETGWVEHPNLIKFKEHEHGEEICPTCGQRRSNGHDSNEAVKVGIEVIPESEPKVDADAEQGRIEGDAQGSEVLDFSSFSDEELKDLAEKAGVPINKRWKRARIEQALRDA